MRQRTVEIVQWGWIRGRRPISPSPFTGVCPPRIFSRVIEVLTMWSGACVVCGKVGVRRRGPRSSTPLCSQRCRHIFRTGGSEMGACKRCGAPYPRSCGRQYCSVACRKGGGRCSYDRVCVVCGRAFAGTRKSVRYCSPACVGRARRTSFLKKRSVVYDGDSFTC